MGKKKLKDNEYYNEINNYMESRIQNMQQNITPTINRQTNDIEINKPNKSSTWDNIVNKTNEILNSDIIKNTSKNVFRSSMASINPIQTVINTGTDLTKKVYNRMTTEEQRKQIKNNVKNKVIDVLLPIADKINNAEITVKNKFNEVTEKNNEKKANDVVTDVEGNKKRVSKLQEIEKEIEVARRELDNDKILTLKSEQSKLEKEILENTSEEDKTALQKITKKSEAFEDGYQFGDITKTAVGTGINMGSNIIGGIADIGQSAGQLGGYGFYYLLKSQGKEEDAKKWLEATQKAQEDYQNMKQGILDITQKNSVLGDTGEQVASSVGQSLAFGSAGKIGGNLLTFASGASAQLDNSYRQEDVEDWQAILRGVAGGAVSTISENIFDNFGFGGTGLSDTLKSTITSKFESGISKALARTFVSGLGEASEEFMEAFGNWLTDTGINWLTSAVGHGAKFDENSNWDGIGESLLVGFLSGGLGEITSTSSNVNTKTSEVVNQIQQDTNSKLNRNEIQKIKNEQLYNYETNLETENLIDREKFSKDKKENKRIQDTLKDKVSNEILSREETTKLIEDIKNERYSIEQNNNKAENRDILSNNQIDNNKQNLEEKLKKDKYKDNENANKFFKSAMENGIDIGNNKVEALFDLPNARGIEAKFDTEIFKDTEGNIKENVNAIYISDSEGKRSIIYNPKAQKETMIEKNAIHETFHDIAGTKESKEVIDFVYNKMKNDVDFQEYYENLKEIYSKVKDKEGRILYNTESTEFEDMIKEEAVADYLGTNLGTQEYINELVNGKESRNIAQRIYDVIVKFLDKITGYKSEEAYLRGLKDKFEKAFNAEYENREIVNKFSINSNFKSDYDSWNKVDRQGNFVIGRTSEALKSIGLNDYDIVMDKSKILKIKNKHPEMTDDIIKSIPEILENPTLILKSQSQNESAKNRNVIFGEINDSKSNPVLVALELNPTENKNNIDKIYKVASAYGKENIAVIQKWLNSKENILYIDNKKNRTMNWLNGLGLQLPVPNNISSSINSITKSKEDVNTTKYSMQENKKNTLMQDNQGRKLSKEQQEYFKESKAIDENGNLIKVYHTTTDSGVQFNEFNPVGTPGYRFGNNIVNYFTESKDMSGSYANNKYQMADTSKFNNIEEAEKWLKEQNTVLDEFEIVKQKDTYYIKSNDRPFGNFSFTNEKDLLKNLKEKFIRYRTENLGYTKDKSKKQYQGYVDIKNPYIIDAEGRNWDKTNIKVDASMKKELDDIKKDTNKVVKLMQLQEESYKKFEEYRDSGKKAEYSFIEDVSKDIGRGKGSEFKSIIEDCTWFGFEYDDYIKPFINEGIKLPNSNIKIKDLYEQYFDNHDPNDIKDRFEKIRKYGDMTLKEYLKEANSAYNQNIKYEKPYSYFKENYSKVVGKSFYDYSSESNITPEKLYKLSERNFDKNAIYDILGERQTTNDIVKQVLEMNKNGSNYDGVIIKNVLDYGGDSLTREPANLYVTFNSNQFKADDNLNPTIDNDIRYSQEDGNKWQEYLEKHKINKEGTRTTLGEIQLQQNINKENITNISKEGLEQSSPSNSSQYNATKKVRDYETAQRNIFKKGISSAFGISQFNNNNKEILNTALNQIKSEYNQRGRISDEVKNNIFNNLYNNLVKEDRLFYDENKQIKDNIRTTRLYVDEKIKMDIADYNEFRKNSMGSVLLTSDEGNIPVDTYYKELTEMNPILFPDTITNPSDQLKRIVEVSKSIKKSEMNVKAYDDKFMAKEYRKYAEEEFNKNIDKLTEQFKVIDNYNQEKIKENQKEDYIIPEVEEIRFIYENRNTLQKEVEKQEKNLLLTNREKAIVDRLLKDEMDINEILPGLNKEGIVKSYYARQQLDYMKDQIKQYKAEVKQNLKDVADSLTIDSEKWKDKKAGILYSRETAIRNMQDIMSRESADRINKELFEPIIHNTSEQTRFLNDYARKVEDLKLDKKAKYEWKDSDENLVKIDEATVAQLLIEKKIDDEYLKNNNINVERIHNIADTFKKILEDTVNQMDNIYIQFGYAPVEKRQNYFPHFIENKPDTFMSKFANAFGFKVGQDNLPTDIAGRTETFKPGRAFNRNILQRTTEKTDYNALKVLDMYMQGASDIIYHTEDIQKLRAFSESIRDKYKTKEIQKKLDEINENTELTDEERETQRQRIKDTIKNPLNNLVMWLDEYTNILANKKAKADRQMEQDAGRQAYTTIKDIEGKIASNLIGGNFSVALTNFAPLAQASGTTELGNLLIGMVQTTQNTITEMTKGEGDDFTYESDFLTSRRGNELTQKETFSQKISNIISTPMEIIDNFTSEAIVRAKYRENIKKGMEHQEALKNADMYARNLMADRSKGAMPTLFNRTNPGAKLLTAFQIEPNNIISNYFKDMPRDSKINKQNLAFQITKLSVASYAFNTILKSIRGGGDVIPNPIGIVSQLISLAMHNLDDDDENDEEVDKVITSIANDIFGSIPFGSAISIGLTASGVEGFEDSGKLMVSSAVPNMKKVSKLFKKDVSSEYKKQVIANELTKPLLYLGLPTGSAQILKTLKGLYSYAQGGSYSYNEKGEKSLQFPIEKNIVNVGKSALFGKYSLPRAQKYINNNFDGLNSKETEIYDNSNIEYDRIKEYFNYSKKENKIDYINDNLKEISEEDKWNLYKYNILSDTKRKDGTSQLTDAEFIFKNKLVTKSEYMKLYGEAEKNNVEFPDTETLKNLKEINLSLEKYMKYKTDLKNENEKKKSEYEKKQKNMLPVSKEKAEKSKKINTSETIALIQNKSYTNQEKEAIYLNYIDKEDENYSNFKLLNNNDVSKIDSYLKYRRACLDEELESDKEDDGTKNGKTIKGSAKRKVREYLDNTNFSELEKLYLIGTKYVLNASEKIKFEKYINESYLTEEEVKKVYKKLKGTVEMKDGHIKWQ